MCYDAGAPTPAPRSDDGDDVTNDDTATDDASGGCPSGQFEPCQVIRELNLKIIPIFLPLPADLVVALVI